ncbi:MAG: endoglucanase [Frankiaceae bacterium]|jgi:hypothetical protein|nr:endoglucanase [Frankiaceae bacterium]
MRRARTTSITTSAALVLSLAVAGVTTGAVPRASATTTAPYLQVSGTTLVDRRTGADFQMRGVNRDGTEVACVGGATALPGPTDDSAMKPFQDWDINTVRVPLNESCWNGNAGIAADPTGATYRADVVDFVNRLSNAGLFVILDLHWSHSGTAVATGQDLMANADNSLTFWSSVASTFASNPYVVFEPYNEPHDISWACWLSGCTAGGVAYTGMQQIVDTIRAAGAQQVILLSGLHWAADPSGVLTHEPTDPLGQEMVNAHLYYDPSCTTSACWDSRYGYNLGQAPFVIDEIGDDVTGCQGIWMNNLLTYLDQRDAGYLVHVWAPSATQTSQECGVSGTTTWNTFHLLASWDGTPTPYGAWVRLHFVARANGIPGASLPLPA